jgi:hypothetical protein
MSPLSCGEIPYVVAQSARLTSEDGLEYQPVATVLVLVVGAEHLGEQSQLLRAEATPGHRGPVVEVQRGGAHRSAEDLADHGYDLVAVEHLTAAQLECPVVQAVLGERDRGDLGDVAVIHPCDTRGVRVGLGELAAFEYARPHEADVLVQRHRLQHGEDQSGPEQGVFDGPLGGVVLQPVGWVRHPGEHDLPDTAALCSRDDIESELCLVGDEGRSDVEDGVDAAHCLVEAVGIPQIAVHDLDGAVLLRGGGLGLAADQAADDRATLGELGHHETGDPSGGADHENRRIRRRHAYSKILGEMHTSSRPREDNRTKGRFTLTVISDRDESEGTWWSCASCGTSRRSRTPARSCAPPSGCTSGSRR